MIVNEDDSEDNEKKIEALNRRITAGCALGS